MQHYLEFEKELATLEGKATELRSNNSNKNNPKDSKEAESVLTGIAEGQYNPSQIASFLTVFMMRSITLEELEGFRKALQKLCLAIDLSEFSPIDLCGTGGDGKDTFNISTLASNSAGAIESVRYAVIRGVNSRSAGHAALMRSRYARAAATVVTGGRRLGITIARRKRRAVWATTCVSISPSRRCTCQSSGAMIEI